MVSLASMMINVLCVLVVLPTKSKKDPFTDVELTSITFAIILMVAVNASVKMSSKKMPQEPVSMLTNVAMDPILRCYS